MLLAGIVDQDVLPNALSVSATIRSEVSCSPISPRMVIAWRPSASTMRFVSAASSSSHR